jgi:hypothetical protein
MKVTREMGTVLRDTTMSSPVYIDARTAPIKLYGFYEPYRRTPESVALATSETVTRLHTMGPSARVRFRTNSDIIVIHADLSSDERVGTMPVLSSSSFEMHFVEDGKHVFKGSFVPSQGEGKNYVECRLKVEPVMHDVIIYFPINASVENFYVGFREGCDLEEGSSYTYETPVVFYGSSIVHGIGACRPGMNYPSQVSRMLDTNVYNLGFGGGARGEDAIIDFIADQKMSVFVYDYDHNAPNAEHLEKTHYAGYKRFRAKQPTTPIIMASKPDYDLVNENSNPEINEKRMRIIEQTYLRAKAEGDKNVYFINGDDIYKPVGKQYCTVDKCHPNDLGFYCMANIIGKTIERILEEK